MIQSADTIFPVTFVAGSAVAPDGMQANRVYGALAARREGGVALNFSQLEMFQALVECGGYTQAGVRLNISHSAIHRQVRILEDELQVRLVYWAGKQLSLTEAGKALLMHAAGIRANVENAKRHIRQLTNLEFGQLRIGTSTNIVVFFLPEILRQFRVKYPAVEMGIKTGTATQIINLVGEGILDVGIGFFPTKSPKAQLRYEFLYQEEFVLALGKSSLPKYRGHIDAKKLRELNLIMAPQGSHIREVINGLFGRLGIVPKVVMELENEEAMEKMVEINMGAAFLSEKRARKDNFQYVRVAGHPIRSEVGIVCPVDEYASPAVMRFLSACQEHVLARCAPSFRFPCGAGDSRLS